jgi:hypothetical protein
VASRTRSKTGHLDKSVGDRTRSKLQVICSSSGHGVFSPLYDIFMLQGQENLKSIDLHLGSTDCKIYHSAFMRSKSQTELDRLHQLHVLDMTEDDKDKSWECTKLIKYCEEIERNTCADHKCLVEWNDIDWSQLWVNFFELNLSNLPLLDCITNILMDKVFLVRLCFVEISASYV